MAEEEQAEEDQPLSHTRSPRRPPRSTRQRRHLPRKTLYHKPRLRRSRWPRSRCSNQPREPAQQQHLLPPKDSGPCFLCLYHFGRSCVCLNLSRFLPLSLSFSVCRRPRSRGSWERLWHRYASLPTALVRTPAHACLGPRAQVWGQHAGEGQRQKMKERKGLSSLSLLAARPDSQRVRREGGDVHRDCHSPFGCQLHRACQGRGGCCV